MFARKLRSLGNKVTLDILPGLPHGFLNLLQVKRIVSIVLYINRLYMNYAVLILYRFVIYRLRKKQWKARRFVPEE